MDCSRLRTSILGFALAAVTVVSSSLVTTAQAGAGRGRLGADPMRQGGRRPRKLLPPEVFVGTVVDITGHLVAVHSDDSKTIRVSYVKGVVPPELVPGKTVQVTGTLRNGITYDPKIEITGGTPWPPAHAPKPRSGRVEHIFFVIQENHSFDNYFG